MDYLDACRIGSAALARDEAGRLYRQMDGDWAQYDFNGEYAGYYPACRFTALAACGELFYAAGTDGQGRPHLFSSLSGGVWDEHNLTAQTPLGERQSAEGNVLTILYDAAAHQILLVTDAGQAVTLPDCPKCVRVRPLNGRPVAASLRNGILEIDLTDGAKQRIPLEALRQYRISWSYAGELLRQGARIVDVREAEDYARAHFPGSVSVPFAGLEDWLAGQAGKGALLFICRTGVLADDAAAYARLAGWENAYSMGGLEPYAHVN